MRKVGLEPTRVSSLPPQSSASTNSATFAKVAILIRSQKEINPCQIQVNILEHLADFKVVAV